MTTLREAAQNRTTVDSGALKMALNVLRRAGKNEIADELEKTAIRAALAQPQQEPTRAYVNQHCAWIVEWGAISLPFDSPSRLTCLQIFHKESEAFEFLYSTQKEVDARMWVIALPDPITGEPIEKAQPPEPQYKDALNRAAYALFQIKRMAPEAIVEFAKAEHGAACKALDAESFFLDEPPEPPKGYKLVPVEPTEAHIESMAIRLDHGHGIAQSFPIPETKAGFKARQELNRRICRQLYEEAIGEGFFKIAAAPEGK